MFLYTMHCRSLAVEDC